MNAEIDGPKRVPFGRPMRDMHFNFDTAYTPLNHGSYGAFPNVIRERQREIQTLADSKPDTFIRYDLPQLLDKSRAAVAPLLGVPTDEVVFVPNATTAVNTVLRNLLYDPGEVILYFSTIYGACQKTIQYVCETTAAESHCIELQYPLEDDEILHKFRDAVAKIVESGKQVKIAMFDTVLTFPGVRMPWEALVQACKELKVMSLIDGAHGIGHIDLTKMGQVGPDFFTSNCYKCASSSLLLHCRRS
jgi:hercynylcysteine S-oxide lyase